MGISKNDQKLHESNERRVEEIRKAEKERQDECILKINKHVELSINGCRNNLVKKRFFEAEQEISKFAYEFGLMLIELYLISFHLNVDYMKWLSQGKYYLKSKLKYRQIKTMFGIAMYGRCYLEGKTGINGIYASDKELSITRDGFSPQVIKYVTNLSTRMSFKSSCELFKRFCNWAPTTESV